MKTKRNKSVLMNRVEIPMAVHRDTILERDQTYRENLTSLYHRINSGKVDRDTFRRIQPSLAMSALRRAGVNLHDSRRLLSA